MPFRTVRLLLLALALSGAARSAPGAQLNTKDLIGFWVGNWHDDTFGTGGIFTLRFEPLGTQGSVLVTWQFGGNFFGCGPVGPVSGALETHGQNAITAHGLHASGPDDVFGQTHIKSKGTTFLVRGKHACNGAGPRSYRSKGTLVGIDFTDHMKAKVEGGMDELTFTLHKVE